jgi:hypothetical protein
MVSPGAAWGLRMTLRALTVFLAVLLLAFASAGAQPARPADPPRFPKEADFLAENNAAMDTMMRDMAVKPSGDADADFAAMMIPHHQGAIDMAVAELRYGRNEKLRRIAQEIIVDQQQEIVAMRMALDQKRPAPAPTQSTAKPR